jgi:hypothetical protein
MNIKLLFLWTLGIVCSASGASATSLIQPHMSGLSANVVNARIICEQNGYCYHHGRRPVVRWVYGDKVFYGPYVGPGHYGWPGGHNGWWLF